MGMDRFKKLFFLFIVSFFALVSKGQQTHFIYLQTDDGQPFYVKMNHQIISSSSEGFVILPGLIDSSYEVKVGFPKDLHPEETYHLTVDNKNKGFIIKNFQDKGMELFNLETLDLIAATNGLQQDTVAAVTGKKQEANPFTQLLANVVNDSSILETHQVVIDKPEKQADTASVVNKTDSSTVAIVASDSSVAHADSTIAAAPEKPVPSSVTGENTGISKILSKENEQGLTMIYEDASEKPKDTVNVFIPGEHRTSTTDSVKSGTINNETVESKNQDISQPNRQAGSSADSAGLTISPTVIKNENADSDGYAMRKDSVSTKSDLHTAPTQVFIIGPEKEKKNETKGNHESAINIDTANKPEEKLASISEVKITDKSKTKKEENKTAGTESTIEVLPKVVTSSTVNSDCKDFASNEDFLRLRKKMASENSDDAMIRMAKRYFKSKCFSTSQIKDLSYLFLTDEGKYKFFDAAYAYTSDSDQYETLESQLSNEYYLNRFKAMIRK